MQVLMRLQLTITYPIKIHSVGLRYSLFKPIAIKQGRALMSSRHSGTQRLFTTEQRDKGGSEYINEHSYAIITRIYINV